MTPRTPRAVVRAIAALALVAAAVAAGAVAAVAAVAVDGAPGSPVDAVRAQEWFLAALHAPQAWHITQGAGVTVAVLADGIDTRHADLSGSVTAGPDYVRAAGKSGSKTAAAAGTVGTGVASLIVGHGHGARQADGVLGIAPAARVLSITVTLPPGDPRWSRTKLTSGLPDAIAAGIRYAVQHGASVIELPADPRIPGPFGNSPAAASGNPAERAAVSFALSKNVVLVAPAGDNALAGGQPAYPASYPGVIAVGAIGRTGSRLRTSSVLSYVALTATGQDIAAAAPSGYQTMNGTWAASALVAGIAALVRSQFPNLTAVQVRHALIGGATAAGPNGSPAADALGALNSAATMSPPHAQPAMLGARPRLQPAEPAVPTQGSLIAHRLLRDGVMSAVILAVLLIPVISYNELARRRERRAMLVAERERLDQARQVGDVALDPLLELFQPQHARPPAPRQRAPVTPRYAPPAQITAGRSPGGMAARFVPLSAAANRVGGPGGPAGPAAPAPGPGLDYGGQGTGSDAFSKPGDSVFWTPAAPRTASPLDVASAVSHRPVTGAPPWELASKPDSDLPWVQPLSGDPVPDPAAAPIPAQDAHRADTYGFLASSTFPAASQQAEPRETGPHPIPTASPAGVRGMSPSGSVPPGPPPWLWDEAESAATAPRAAPATDPQATSRDSGERPIYVWNPPADAESKPGPPWRDQPAPWDAQGPPDG